MVLLFKVGHISTFTICLKMIIPQFHTIGIKQNWQTNKPLGGVRSKPLILQNPTGKIQGEVAW